MEVKIQIDDGKLAKLVSDEIGNLDKEIIHDIAVSALKQYFSDNKNIEDVIVKKHSYGDWTLQPFVVDMLEKAIKPEDVREFTEKILEVARTKSDRLLKEVILSFFLKNIFSEENKYNLMYKIQEMIEQSK